MSKEATRPVIATPANAKQKQHDIEAIRKLGNEWLDAEREKNIDRLLSLVTDDVVFLAPNTSPIKGKSALATLYRGYFAQFDADHRATAEEIEVLGDCAYGWGSEELALRSGSGGEVSLKGKGMSILRRGTDGSWKFARGINNLRPEAQPTT